MKHHLFVLIIVLLFLIPLAQAKLEEEDFNKWAQKDFKGKVKEYIDKLGTDAVLGQEMSNEMQQLVQSAKADWDNEQGDGCALAANLLADWNLNELSREYLKGGLRTVKNIMKNILSLGSSTIIDFLKGKAKDQIENAIKDYFDTQPPEVYTNERSNTGELACGNTYERIIWDKKAGTFEIFIAGDCQCKEVQIVAGKGARIKLKNWVVYISGEVKVTIEDEKAKYSLVNVKQMTYANCGCDVAETTDGSSSSGTVTGGDTIDGGNIPNGDIPDRTKDKSRKTSWLDRIISWFGFGKKPAASGQSIGTGTGNDAGERDTGTGDDAKKGSTGDTGEDDSKPSGATKGSTRAGTEDTGKDDTRPPKPPCGDKVCGADEDCQSCRADCPCASGTFCYYGTCKQPECTKDSDCVSKDACKIGRCVNPKYIQYASCEYPNVLICNNGDGCCPSGCTYKTDSDCENPASTTTTTPPLPPTTPTPDCIWTCGSWGECSSSGSQTRTCSSSPSPCTGTNPNPTSQTCTPACNLDNLRNCLSENCVKVYGPGGSANCPEQCKIDNGYDNNCLTNQCNIPYQNCIAACHISNPPCTQSEAYALLETIS